jgi:DNA-binding NtrC family response regulator
LKTILVVEDDASARRLMHHGFRSRHRVLEARDAREATAILEAERVDLVLLDLHLPPDRDSPREGLRLRAHLGERFPRIPVVVVTGDGGTDVRRELRRGNVGVFFEKPVEFAVLDRVVSTLLSGREADDRGAMGGAP